jgi:hypothetical protein
MKKIIFIAAISILSISLSAQSYRGNVYVQSYEEKLNDMYCTGLFKSTHGTIFDMTTQINANGFLNILDWLQGRVAGLQIFTTLNGTRIPVIRGNVPGIYLDEMNVSPGLLNAININDIAIIKIIKTPFFGGFNGGNGAIAIYTLGGEDEEE